MDALFITKVLASSPSSGVTDACAPLMHDLAEVTSQGYHLRVPFLGAASADIYQGSRTPAGVAEFVATSTTDPATITKLTKDRRVGVLLALSTNASLDLEALKALHERARTLGLARDLTSRLEAQVRRLLEGRTDVSDPEFEVLRALPWEVSSRPLAMFPGLSESQLRTLLRAHEHDAHDSWVSSITARGDLAAFSDDLHRDLADALALTCSPGHLTKHPDLLALGLEVLTVVSELDPAGLFKRPDVPVALARTVLVRELAQSRSSARAYRLGLVLAAMSANPAVDAEVFAELEVQASPHALGRVLAHRFGDDALLWETALKLAPSMMDSSIDELVSTSRALV